MQLNLSNIEYAYPAAAEPALNGVTATFVSATLKVNTLLSNI